MTTENLDGAVYDGRAGRSRAEHLEWCRERALAELDVGPRGVVTAIASIQSDLRKHPDTRDHGAILLAAMMQVAGQLENSRQVREFLEGIR